MKRFILAVIIITLAFSADCFALNLRPYMQTPPEVQVFAKRVIEDGGKVVDLEYCQKYTRLSKQLIVWSNGKFVGDANMGVKLNSGVSVQTLYDLSGNNNDATSGVTVNNQPVWTKNVQGGRAGMVFDGNDVLKKTLGAAIENPSTVIFIGKQTATNSAYKVGFDGITTNRRNLISYNTGVNGNLMLFAGASLISGFNVINVPLLLTAIFNGASSDFLKDGSSIVSGNCGAQGIDGISVGDDWDTAYPWIGSIDSIIVFNIALNSAQRQACENFVNAYYSIY
uniref:Lectin/glucanase superfamily protein n=1 Tax=viral metagenome TaxID=1070528 RepID=A0A6H1ZJS0_9ZZZZ